MSESGALPILGVMTISISLGLMRPGKLRSALVAMVCLAPVAAICWIAAQPNFAQRSVLATRGEFVFIALFLGMPIWAALTLFPFKLTSRLLAIHRGD
jgi:hypothetical protein